MMLSQLDKMSGLIVTRLHPVGWVCSRVPCGNRYSTSQGTVPPITDTLIPGDTAQPIVTCLQTVSFVNKIPVLILRKPATLVFFFVWYHNTPLTISGWLCK